MSNQVQTFKGNLPSHLQHVKPYCRQTHNHRRLLGGCHLPRHNLQARHSAGEPPQLHPGDDHLRQRHRHERLWWHCLHRLTAEWNLLRMV